MFEDPFNVQDALQSREAKFRQKIRDDRIRLERLEVIKSEYEALDTTLTSIVEKRKHKIMVPIGKKAFMSGHLTHTNEVTVAIGDNYFIKCSVHHAKGIVARRKEMIQNNIDRFKEEFEFLKKQIGLAAEVLDVKEKTTDEDTVEIREEYNSDDDIDILPRPQPERKPVIEVMASAENDTTEDDPFLQVIDHFASLEMKREHKESVKGEKKEESKITPKPITTAEKKKITPKPGEPYYAPPPEKKKITPKPGEPYYAPPAAEKKKITPNPKQQGSSFSQLAPGNISGTKRTPSDAGAFRDVVESFDFNNQNSSKKDFKGSDNQEEIGLGSVFERDMSVAPPKEQSENKTQKTSLFKSHINKNATTTNNSNNNS